MNYNKNTITVLGRVSSKMETELKTKINLNPETYGFFIDFAQKSFEIDTVFSIVQNNSVHSKNKWILTFVTSQLFKKHEFI